MTNSQNFTLFIIGICVALVVASFQSVPGYMDAEYYYSGGMSISKGDGFTEEFLWNYLDNPEGLPHPSHTYWMPLASIVSALGIWIGNVANDTLYGGLVYFPYARIFFFLLLGFVPPLTAALYLSLNKLKPSNDKDRKHKAFFAGLLATIPVFYMPYVTTTDTFSISMFLGVLFFLVISRLSNSSHMQSREVEILYLVLLGVLSGLLYLARADGVLWFFMAMIAVLRWSSSNENKVNRGAKLTLLSVGFLLISGPWLYRNYLVFGSFFSPGGSLTLWLTEYNDIFSYPASTLNLESWLSSGIDELFRVRIWAFGANLLRTVAEQGEIILTPLILLGIFKMRRNPTVQLGIIVWISTFFMMTFIFPYAGARGGLFHSAASIQPLLWALVPIGLDGFVEWGSRFRNWHIGQARLVFSIGTFVISLFITFYVTYNRTIGPEMKNPRWDDSLEAYVLMDDFLTGLSIPTSSIIMVNNPPGFFIASGRSAIVIPNGDLESLLAAAEHYQASYLILEEHHPIGLDTIFRKPDDNENLEYIPGDKDIYLFRIGK